MKRQCEKITLQCVPLEGLPDRLQSFGTQRIQLTISTWNRQQCKLCVWPQDYNIAACLAVVWVTDQVLCLSLVPIPFLSLSLCL